MLLCTILGAPGESPGESVAITTIATYITAQHNALETNVQCLAADLNIDSNIMHNTDINNIQQFAVQASSDKDSVVS